MPHKWSLGPSRSALESPPSPSPGGYICYWWICDGLLLAGRNWKADIESGITVGVKLPLVFVIVCAVVAVTVFFGNRHDDRLWRDYKVVRPGMSAEQAKAVLGKPSWEGPCASKFPYGLAATCRTELGYRAAFASVNPLYWVVQLDNRNRVVAVDWIGSP